MVILGLGSNVGDRVLNLAKAVSIISKTALAAIEVSSIYESEALLKPNSPESWNKPFLNMAIIGETHLSPIELLKEVKRIEKLLGRKDIGAWGPREIDIDILAYGSQYINTAELVVPHKELCKRPFALLPLAELAPNWQYPVDGAFAGKTAYEISHQMFGKEVPQAVKTDYSLEAAGQLA